jgi:hypothetical protein
MFASRGLAFNNRTNGQPTRVDRVNPEFDDSRNDTGGVDDSLRPMEALDPDDVRNDDGDEVVDARALGGCRPRRRGTRG